MKWHADFLWHLLLFYVDARSSGYLRQIGIDLLVVVAFFFVIVLRNMNMILSGFFFEKVSANVYKETQYIYVLHNRQIVRNSLHRSFLNFHERWTFVSRERMTLLICHCDNNNTLLTMLHSVRPSSFER